MEYQVGDKVVVKEDLNIDGFYGLTCLNEHVKECGKILEIVGKTSDNCYNLKENIMIFSKEMLRPLRILEAVTKLNLINIIIHDEEEFDTLMRFFDDNNICWSSGDKASDKHYWNRSSNIFYIQVHSDFDRIYSITYGTEKSLMDLKNVFRYEYFDELKQYEPVKFISSNADFADAMSYATSYLNSNKISICPDKITVCADRFNIPDGYKLDGKYLDEEKTNFKEENIMKILDIYEEKQTKLIEKKYDKQIEELEEDDRLRVYFKQVEETVREMLELTEDEICTVSLNTPVISLTKETIAKREEIVKLIREEKAELKNKIKEIQALLELAPNYEEKIQILRDYGIIDKKKNIIL